MGSSLMLKRREPLCKQCKQRMPPGDFRPIHEDCIHLFVAKIQADNQRKRSKQAQEEKRLERNADKERKARLETVADLIKVADSAFQAWVKARDQAAGYNECISSGRPLEWGTRFVNAGHYRSKGAASAQRYNPDNCHAQSQHDNLWKAGNVADYRIRLIQRIGLERVEALECANAVHKWTHEELREIAAKYRAKLRDLRKSA